MTFVLVASLVANAYLFKERDSFALDIDLQKQANTDLQKQVAFLRNQTVVLGTEISSLQSEKSSLVDQNANLQNQVENLIGKTDILQNENSNLSAKIVSLQSTISDLQMNLLNRPNLVTRLGVTDVRNNSDGRTKFVPRLFVQGAVFNTGGVTARNAKLHITLFVGNQTVEDTYIELGIVEPLSAVSVEKNIPYDTNGARLTNWTIIPEFSS